MAVSPLSLTAVMMELVSAKVEVTLMTRRKQLGDDWTLAGDTIGLPAAGPGTAQRAIFRRLGSCTNIVLFVQKITRKKYHGHRKFEEITQR